MGTEAAARVREILAAAKRLAAEYHRITGKPLGVTGEVAEYVGRRNSWLEPPPPQTTGYDALRGSERIQIEGRAHGTKTNTNAFRERRFTESNLGLSLFKRIWQCETGVAGRLRPSAKYGSDLE
jgi:hypothetical protein